jgi:hypothetical protein
MRRSWLLSFDLTAVVVFVAVGRSTHGENPSVGGFLHTAAPFLIGLVLGWAVMRAWRRPTAIPTGVGVVVATVAAGMLLRHFVFEDGTAVDFVLVATAFLTLFLVGWRLLARRLVANRRP